MVNDAIRICLDEKIRGRLKLRDRIYRDFRERYGVVSCFPYSVAEVAWSIVKKHKRWHRKPYAKRLMLKMDAANFSLNYSILSLPFKKGERVLIPLRYGEYQRSFLMDKTLKRGSVTMTESSIVIAFSKESPTIRAIEEGRLRPQREVRRRERRDEARPLRGRSPSYALWDSAVQVLRETSSRQASQEEVRFIQKREGARESSPPQGLDADRRKGEGEQRGDRPREAQGDQVPPQERERRRKGKAAQGRPMAVPAAAVLHRLQGEMGGCPCGVRLPLLHVEDLHVCGAINRKLKLTERSWLCPCGAMLDRDLNAAINIERRGKIRCLGEVRPGARDTDEAMKGNETTTAPILRAEAPKSILRESPVDWTEPYSSLLFRAS